VKRDELTGPHRLKFLAVAALILLSLLIWAIDSWMILNAYQGDLPASAIQFSLAFLKPAMAGCLIGLAIYLLIIRRSLTRTIISVNESGRHCSDLVPTSQTGDEHLEQRSPFLGEILESLPYPLYVIDTENHTVLMANSAAGANRFTGQPPCHLLGHGLSQWCLPPDHPCPLEGVKKTRKPVTVEHCHYDRQGSARYFDVHLYPVIDDNGKVTRVIECTLDVTDRKRLELLAAHSERLKALADLTSGLAHNFNNLLQIVIGGLQLAGMHLKTGEYAKVQAMLDQVLESSHLGVETVKRLQSFASRQSELTPLQRKTFDLSHTVRQAVEMSKPWWRVGPQKEGLKVFLNYNLEPGCLVCGNETDIFEVVTNFIKNAVEALPQGGDIYLHSSVEGEKVVLEVQDTGTGIPEENLNNIFKPFWSSKGSKGTGMGLASNLAIVRRHGGEISVKSTEGQGTTFTVRLPRATETEVETELEDAPAEDTHFRILIIDDMKPVLKLLESGLRKHGETVFTASSGREGLDLIERTPLDVIICDLVMPAMNGWEVGAAVRAFAQRKGIPKPLFILLTGWGGQLEEKERMTDCGIDGALEKPVEVLQLLKYLREVARKIQE
jgi:PAS domain S-box-containing protein